MGCGSRRVDGARLSGGGGPGGEIVTYSWLMGTSNISTVTNRRTSNFSVVQASTNGPESYFIAPESGDLQLTVFYNWGNPGSLVTLRLFLNDVQQQDIQAPLFDTCLQRWSFAPIAVNENDFLSVLFAARVGANTGLMDGVVEAVYL